MISRFLLFFSEEIMQQLVFDVPVKVFMGSGSLSRIGRIAAEAGSRAIIITGTNVLDSGIPARVEMLLQSAGITSIIFSNIGPHTTAEAVDQACRLSSSGRAQMVVGVGGVKTLSIARAVSILASSNMRAADYIDGLRPEAEALPLFSVMTACRDPFAFVDSMMLIDGRSRSCRLCGCEGYFADAVFIEPELASTIPSSTFKFSLMENFMYAVEGYMSDSCNYLSENLFLKAISAVVTSDYLLSEDGDDPEAYEKAAKAGLVTGLGLSMAGPGLGAALAMVIAARFRVPRVLAAAVVLPLSLEHSLKFNPEKVARLAPIIQEDAAGLDAVAAAERVIDRIRHRIGVSRVQVRLSEFGITADDLAGIAEDVRKFDFLAQFPAPLSVESLVQLLRKAL